MTSGYHKKAASRKYRIKTRLKAYIQSQKKHKICGICQDNCEMDFLTCKICENESHRLCLKISKKKAQKLRETDSFICSNKCYNSVLPFFDVTDEIDLVCLALGNGKHVCPKCRRGLHKYMSWIGCSNCERRVHKVCSKLSDVEFEKTKYYFCSNKCAKIKIPEDSENTAYELTDVQSLVQENNKNGHFAEKTPKTNFTEVKDHLLDLKCSYIESNDITTSLLEKRKYEINIFQSNIRSLNANFERIHDIFVNCNELPDILALTETWLKDDSDIPHIEGYNFEGINSKITQNAAGGVGFYISSDIEYDIRNDLSIGHNGCEDLWINLKSSRTDREKKSKSPESLIVGVIYRHPTQDYKSFSKSLSKTLSTLNEKKLNYVIVGDINVNSLKYNVASNITEYINCLQSLSCNLFIDKPTRVKSGCTPSCIDHLYSNLPTDSIISRIIYSDISDHFPILSRIDFAIHRRDNEPVYRRKNNLSTDEWYKFNFDLNSNLRDEISLVETGDCPNYLAEKITSIYQKLLDKYMPLKKLTRKEKSFLNKPWITNEIKSCIRKCTYLLHKSRRTQDPAHLEEHREYRSVLSKLKRQEYNKYYKEKIAKYGEDKAKTWRLINEITNRKKKKNKSIDFLIDKHGNRIENKDQIASCLNRHFSTVGKTKAAEFERDTAGQLRDPIEYLSNINVQQSALFPNTTLSEILDILKSLDPNKSCGFDLISNRV